MNFVDSLMNLLCCFQLHLIVRVFIQIFMTFFFPIPKSGATESHPDRAWAAGKLGIIEQCFATVAFISTIALPDLNGTMYTSFDTYGNSTEATRTHLYDHT